MSDKNEHPDLTVDERGREYKKGDVLVRCFRKGFIGDQPYFVTANYDNHGPGMIMIVVDTALDEHGRALVMWNNQNFRYRLRYWFERIEDVEKDQNLTKTWTETGKQEET